MFVPFLSKGSLGPEFAQIHLVRPHKYSICVQGHLVRQHSAGLMTTPERHWYAVANGILYEYSPRKVRVRCFRLYRVRVLVMELMFGICFYASIPSSCSCSSILDVCQRLLCFEGFAREVLLRLFGPYAAGVSPATSRDVSSETQTVGCCLHSYPNVVRCCTVNGLTSRKQDALPDGSNTPPAPAGAKKKSAGYPYTLTTVLPLAGVSIQTGKFEGNENSLKIFR